ncbi:hypothetical protein OR16_06499 [Cupriavidus basilensis OR16]|uniref:Uncharacterized protein n=1 Tax=Cupriavidus basilensis OR16 TaxID=1127483 RepID=H1S1B8_9BURK|nr:hypothetical protein [Cupriavidus basilensis]EHP43731.1 hypothetical protein OR16_06499 [Cupriavidus basilensis OR16]
MDEQSNMNKKMSAILMAASTIVLAAPAHAQADPAALKGMYDMSRNVVGLTSYCVGKGFLKADSVKNARKMVGLIAEIPGVDTSAGEASETSGLRGNVLMPDGKEEGIESSKLGARQWCKDAAQGVSNFLKSAAAS